MNEIKEEIFKCIRSDNFHGAFDLIDNYIKNNSFSLSTETLFNELKNEYISNRYGHKFSDRLAVFVEKCINEEYISSQQIEQSENDQIPQKENFIDSKPDTLPSEQVTITQPNHEKNRIHQEQSLFASKHAPPPPKQVTINRNNNHQSLSSEELVVPKPKLPPSTQVTTNENDRKSNTPLSIPKKYIYFGIVAFIVVFIFVVNYPQPKFKTSIQLQNLPHQYLYQCEVKLISSKGNTSTLTNRAGIAAFELSESFLDQPAQIQVSVPKGYEIAQPDSNYMLKANGMIGVGFRVKKKTKEHITQRIVKLTSPLIIKSIQEFK